MMIDMNEEEKKVCIYGAHVKCEYVKSYVKLEDIAHEGMRRSNEGIWDLVHSSSKMLFKRVQEEDCLKHVPYDLGRRNLNCFAEVRRGKPKFRGIPGLVGYPLYDRLILMNDEVMWQWKTGSDLVYRFESIAEAKRFWKWTLDGIVDSDEVFNVPEDDESLNGCIFNIGDRVKLLEDVTFFKKDLDAESAMLSNVGKMQHLPDEVILKKNMIVRVHDVQGDRFTVSPIDGLTAFRVPGTGGAKVVYGTGTALDCNVASLVEGVQT